MEVQLNQNITILSDQRDKMIIMKDKQYIIDKNKLYTTKDDNKISIEGVDNDKLICTKEDEISKILLDINEVIFNDYEIRDSVPYVFYDDTKIFLLLNNFFHLQLILLCNQKFFLLSTNFVM